MDTLKLSYKENKKTFREEVINDVPLLVCPSIADTKLALQCFTTRLGGVSKDHCWSMNLSETREDDPEAVKENRRRIAGVLGITEQDLIYTNQVHSTNVARVSSLQKGMTMKETDGLITNEAGIGLVIFHADCVPVCFLDPVKKAIGACHSGWKGTVNKIAKVTVESMVREFDSDPSDLLVAIGPSICQDCYEVSEDVIDAFKESYAQENWPDLFYKKGNGKYQLNLWRANELNLMSAGVKEENITTTTVCTKCNSDLMFSHRAMGFKRGLLSTCIALKA